MTADSKGGTGTSRAGVVVGGVAILIPVILSLLTFNSGIVVSDSVHDTAQRMCPNKTISGIQRKEEIADAASGVTC